MNVHKIGVLSLLPVGSDQFRAYLSGLLHWHNEATQKNMIERTHESTEYCWYKLTGTLKNIIKSHTNPLNAYFLWYLLYFQYP